MALPKYVVCRTALALNSAGYFYCVAGCFMMRLIIVRRDLSATKGEPRVIHH